MYNSLYLLGFVPINLFLKGLPIEFAVVLLIRRADGFTLSHLNSRRRFLFDPCADNLRHFVLFALRRNNRSQNKSGRRRRVDCDSDLES